MAIDFCSAWVCSKCGRPVRKGGAIQISDVKTGGYPRKPRNSLRPTVRLSVFHHRCDPRPESDAYSIMVTDAVDIRRWQEWVIELSVKDWVDIRLVRRLIRFWFQNRGLPFNA
jgi:hypothetical protein